jgi:hypothetical protein
MATEATSTPTQTSITEIAQEPIGLYFIASTAAIIIAIAIALLLMLRKRP